MTPKPVNLIPLHMLSRGPDLIRGSGIAFILTKYPDPSGNRWFTKDGAIGHEQMTNSPEMLQALFGPNADKIADEFVTLRDVYGKDAKGFPAPTGEKKPFYDYQEIRRYAKKENLFGRYGKAMDYPIVMLWNAPENWQVLLKEALQNLGVKPDSNAVVTVGASDQYMAKDFLSGGHSQEVEDRVANSQRENAKRLELLSRYHIATGPEKVRLGKELGITQGSSMARAGSMSDWNRRAMSQGLGPYVGKYGESYTRLDFKDFLDGKEGKS